MLESVEAASLILGAIIAGFAVVGLGVRMILLPYITTTVVMPRVCEVSREVKALRTETARGMQEIRIDLARVTQQVENSHATNLRDDISRVLLMLEDQQKTN